jgi:hypothetical protein
MVPIGVILQRLGHHKKDKNKMGKKENRKGDELLMNGKIFMTLCPLAYS